MNLAALVFALSLTVQGQRYGIADFANAVQWGFLENAPSSNPTACDAMVEIGPRTKSPKAPRYLLYAGKTRKDWDEFRSVVADKKSRSRVDEIIKSGLAFVVEPGTSAHAFEYVEILSHVKIMEGPHAGKVGWTHGTNLVKNPKPKKTKSKK